MANGAARRSDQQRALRIRVATRQDAILALTDDLAVINAAIRTLRERGSRSIASKVERAADDWTEQLGVMRKVQESERLMIDPEYHIGEDDYATCTNQDHWLAWRVADESESEARLADGNR